MTQAVVCEYFVQNETAESDSKANPYPNVFILPKKYNSITDVSTYHHFYASINRSGLKMS